LWKVRAKQVVLAQGAIEKPLVFAGNDRPGVMLAGAARTYLNRYGVRVGERAVVATAHDTAWAAAFDLARAGTSVAMIVDVRRAVDDRLLAEAGSLGIETLCGGTVTDTKGRLRVAGVRVNPVEASGKVGAGRWIACDALLMLGGWTPSLHLFSHTGGKLDWDEAAQTFLPGKLNEACPCIGAGAGHLGLAAALVAGPQCVAHLDHRAMGCDRPQRAERPQGDRTPRRRDRPGTRQVPAHGGGRGSDLRGADAAVPRQLHGRARFRGQRPGPLWSGRVGGDL
jgi:sarcosine oxidase subunit alpha